MASGPPLGAPDPEHFRRLERMYHAARCNAYYQPRMTVGDGTAEVVVPVRPEFFHAMDAVHGSVYFKVLDDACFFAANSRVPRHWVVTSQFHLHFLAPVRAGELRARGRVVHASGRQLVAEGVAVDGEGRELARGSGTFVVTALELGPGAGYR